MRSRLATTLAAAALLACLSACESVQQATSSANAAADKATLCLEAVRLAGFNPDASNPQKAAEEAQRTADELKGLAEKAGDTTLQTALNDMATKVQELPRNLDPAAMATWTQEKLATADTLSRACL